MQDKRRDTATTALLILLIFVNLVCLVHKNVNFELVTKRAENVHFSAENLTDFSQDSAENVGTEPMVVKPTDKITELTSQRDSNPPTTLKLTTSKKSHFITKHSTFPVFDFVTPKIETTVRVTTHKLSQLRPIPNNITQKPAEKTESPLNLSEIPDETTRTTKLLNTTTQMKLPAPKIVINLNPELETSTWKTISPTLHNKTLLVYVHIPKTAGSAFKSIVQMGSWNLPTKYWFPSHTDHSFSAPGCNPPRNNKIGTHCGFAEIENCINDGLADFNRNTFDGNDQGLASSPKAQKSQFYDSNIYSPDVLTNRKYFSIIRDPVQRVVSEYFWWRDFHCMPRVTHAKEMSRAWTMGNCWKGATHKNNNFTSWILDPENSAHNRQIKSLVYYKNLTYPDGAEASFEKNCNNLDAYKENDFWKAMQIQNDPRDTHIFEKARETLENKYAFVGLTENMRDSVRISHWILGYRNPPGPKLHDKYLELLDARVGHKSHSTEGGKQLNDEDLKLIEEKNWLDIKLYNFVKKKMDDTLVIVNDSGFEFNSS